MLGTEHGEKFLNSGSALSTVLNRNATLRKNFNAKFGDRYRTVRDYYLPRKRLVVIQDVSPFVLDREVRAQTGINIEVNGPQATVATTALSNQANIAKVQEWLGHAQRLR